MLIVIFPYLPGSDSPIFRAFLFSWDSFSLLVQQDHFRIIAGLILTYMRLFKIGDRVKIGDVVGDVIEKSLLVTNQNH
jgi:hypothetical protein